MPKDESHETRMAVRQKDAHPKKHKESEEFEDAERRKLVKRIENRAAARAAAVQKLQNSKINEAARRQQEAAIKKQREASERANGKKIIANWLEIPVIKTTKPPKKLCSKAIPKAIRDAKAELSSYYQKYNLSKKKSGYCITNDDKRKVLTHDEELSLLDYLNKAVFLNYGLSVNKARSLTYEFAISKEIFVPKSWSQYQTAGREFFRRFNRQFPQLTLGRSGSSSLDEAKDINRENVVKFFKNLKTCLDYYKFEPDRIYNISETFISAIHGADEILSPKYVNLLTRDSVEERENNVTMLACINAIGYSLPPMLIFPRVVFEDEMLKGAIPGTIGATNLSRWPTRELFRQFLDHFIKYVGPSKERPVLLLMDSHESHISIDILNTASAHGILLLTIHHHSSHLIQPLDSKVFTSLCKYYNEAAAQWLLNNPNKSLTIYDVAELIGKSYPNAFTSEHIITAFMNTGICPLDESIVSNLDFQCQCCCNDDNNDAISDTAVSDTNVVENSAETIAKSTVSVSNQSNEMSVIISNNSIQLVMCQRVKVEDKKCKLLECNACKDHYYLNSQNGDATQNTVAPTDNEAFECFICQNCLKNYDSLDDLCIDELFQIAINS